MSNDRNKPPQPPPRWPPYISLVTQLGKAKAELDAAQEAYDALADRARSEMPFGEYTDGTFKVLIQRYRIWDKAQALKDHGSKICVLTVDLKLARFELKGKDFEAYYIPQAPRVIVRRIDDEAS